jgi:hypothetical protein
MQPVQQAHKGGRGPAFCKPPSWLVGLAVGLVKWQPFSRFSLCYGHSNNTELLFFTYGNEGPMHATRKRREEKRSERFPCPSSAGAPWVTGPTRVMMTTCALINHTENVSSLTVWLTNKRDSLNVPTDSLERLTPV